MSPLHTAVLLQEAIEGLQIQPGKLYIDATFGRGGHTREIMNKGGIVYAFDVDQAAIEFAKNEFVKEIEEKKLILIRENFDQLQSALTNKEVTQVSGILFDFGTSVDQLKSKKRGFSFHSDAELDMRMDNRLGVKAKDLLLILPENQLAELFKEFGGEEQSKGVARRIVKQRTIQPITTTTQLVDIIEQVKGKKPSRIHPATKVFQALRIAVNSELTSISHALPQALELLESNGRLVTISFHDGEDGIVKPIMKRWQEEGKGELLTKKPVMPSEQELIINPRARSAKLRIFQKK